MAARAVPALPDIGCLLPSEIYPPAENVRKPPAVPSEIYAAAACKLKLPGIWSIVIHGPPQFKIIFHTRRNVKRKTAVSFTETAVFGADSPKYLVFSPTGQSAR